MADLRKIVIEVVEKQAGANKTPDKPAPSPSTPNQPDAPADPESEKHPNDKLDNYRNRAFLMYMFRQGKNAVVSSVSLSLNRRFAVYENYIGQTNFQNAMTAISKMGSAVGSAVGAGLFFGPAGVAVSLASTFVSEIIQVTARMNTAYRQLNITNANTAYAASRAGLVDGGKGTEN